MLKERVDCLKEAGKVLIEVQTTQINSDMLNGNYVYRNLVVLYKNLLKKVAKVPLNWLRYYSTTSVASEMLQCTRDRKVCSIVCINHVNVKERNNKARAPAIACTG